jgi:betaine-aldehyde dehydrogenase
VARLYERDHFLIGGRRPRPSGREELAVVSPSTEEPVGRVPLAAEADVDAAVAAARHAFDEGPWPRLPLEERARILLAAHDALLPQAAALSELVAAEMGVPLALSQVFTARALGVIPSFVEVARGLALEEERPGALADALIVREPVGVAAGIAPWNAPVLNAVVKLTAPLLMGCTVVYKPAAETPLDAYPAVEALQEAGVPPGAVNLVPGGREVGEALVRHSGVDKVAFTGSAAAGRRVGALCGEALKHVTLELGGKSAAIVLDDADLDAAAPALQTAAFGNSGQNCVAFSRVLAPRSRYDEVVELLAARAAALVVGDPFAPETNVGPLVSERQRDRVEGYVRAGRDEGARLVQGGGRPAHLERGWYFEPTVFAGVESGMRIAQEEIFGPVVAVTPYDGEDEAVRIANDSAYGLHGGVFTTSPDRALAVARRIRTGTFTVNGYMVNFDAPFGGVKSSGLGREFGPEGLLAYMEQKTVNFPRPPAPVAATRTE